MTALRIALFALAAGLVALIVWAAANAAIGESFSAISSDPWGLVTLADLYLGFAAAAVVVALVERPLAALAWIVALAALGNAVTAIWLALRLPRIAAALKTAR